MNILKQKGKKKQEQVEHESQQNFKYHLPHLFPNLDLGALTEMGMWS